MVPTTWEVGGTTGLPWVPIPIGRQLWVMGQSVVELGGGIGACVWAMAAPAPSDSAVTAKSQNRAMSESLFVGTSLIRRRAR